MNLTIQPMNHDDLAEVADVEEQCFPDDPWSLPSFVEMMRIQGSFCTVARDENGRLIGYLVSYEVVDEGHLLNLAVIPDQRRQGIGRRILKHWLDEGVRRGWTLAYLEVRSSNTTAIHLYEVFGFRKVGIRHRYYSNGEDAVLMTLEIEQETEAKPSRT